MTAKMKGQKTKAKMSEEDKKLRKEKKKEQRKINKLTRAATLKRKYPNMVGIPRSVTKGKRKKLIREYMATQSAANTEK